MIKVEAYGGGTRWHCPKCDVYHNGRFWIISWTNSTPPKYCTKCENKTVAQKQLEDYAWEVSNKLHSIYQHRYYLPCSNSVLADLIRQHGLQNFHNPHRLAAIINGKARAGH